LLLGRTLAEYVVDTDGQVALDLVVLRAGGGGDEWVQGAGGEHIRRRKGFVEGHKGCAVGFVEVETCFLSVTVDENFVALGREMYEICIPRRGRWGCTLNVSVVL